MNIDTRLMTLDIAMSTGWAFYETRRDVASIRNGVLKLSDGIPKYIDGKKILKAEKRRRLRVNFHEELERLYEQFRPVVVCMEQPLDFIKTGAPAGRKQKFFGQNVQDEDDDGGGGPNAATVLALSQLFAVADEFFRSKDCYLMEVRSQTWQTLCNGLRGETTKDRSILYCQLNGITLEQTTKIARGDAADASVIAVWAATRCQQLKYEKMAREQSTADMFGGAAA